MSSKQLCKRITIVARGKTEEDVGLAVVESLKRITEGNIYGQDTNDSGGFYFHVEDVEDKKEWPR